jgi:hypothetical protein
MTTGEEIDKKREEYMIKKTTTQKLNGEQRRENEYGDVEEKVVRCGSLPSAYRDVPGKL